MWVSVPQQFKRRITRQLLVHMGGSNPAKLVVANRGPGNLKFSQGDGKALEAGETLFFVADSSKPINATAEGDTTVEIHYG
jgi:hypothetical protein